MTDLLVRLYALPDVAPDLAPTREPQVDIRRGIASEKHIVTKWARNRFCPQWASEADVAFNRRLVSWWSGT